MAQTQRHRRRLAALGTIVTLAAGLAGCSSDTVTGTPASEPEPEPAACTFAAGPLACEGAGCSVVTDVSMYCDGHGFPYRPKVAAAADASYLSVDGHVARFAANDGEVLVLPAIDDEGISDASLAIAADGSAYVARPENHYNPGSGRIHVASLPTGEPVTVLDGAPGSQAEIVDFEAAADGKLHLWFWTDDSIAHAVGADGQWTSSTSAPPTLDRYRFGLAADGRELVYGVDFSADPYDLTVIDGGEWHSLGAMIHSQSVQLYFHPAQPAGPGAADDVVAAAMVADGIVLRRLTSAGLDEQLLDSTAIANDQCGGGDGSGDCPESCSTDVEGIRFNEYSMARTTDGSAWIAYITTHLDITYSDYTLNCDGEPGCFCEAGTVDDQTAYALHVVRVTADGTATEVIEEPLALPQVVNGELSPLSNSGNLHARAHGDELTIAVGFGPNWLDAGGGYVRVLRLDTSAL